jgi:hypothetical protein
VPPRHGRARSTVYAYDRIPALILDGGASPQMMRDAAKATAAALPDGRYDTLERQPHDVAPEVLAPALAAFFRG